ncbi:MULTISPECIES: NINE protein [unclassified Arthrobacter]|uniref:NINE protein n=1 Tax=unclassified Arthrobacter TaxID=235627 RepID=UPI002E001CA9|nr:MULTISPECIES: NINE protein [unclassified Arthrobacter]MEC5193395.1 hypothetical protein [Arthrobacter sp. MP_M4]MEC5203289.1 hypothetical protein [Arthrobacter sp. MP_M7]
MTQPDHDPHAIPPEGYYSPAEPPKQGQQAGYPAGPQQPYGGQQAGYPAGPQQPYGGQQPGYPAGPQQPYGGQQPYQGYPPSPQQYRPGPPMPNPAYGYPQPKSKIVAGLLGIFLGGLGIHRFYLGFTKIAVIQLVLTIVLGVFTFGLVGLWGVVEGIMIIAGSAYFRADAHGIPLRD